MPVQVTTMEQLCDDLLLEIFSHLSLKQQIRVQRVCHRWLDLLRKVCAPRRLRIELTQYPRPPRRRLTESGQLAFEHAPTIRPKDEQQLKALSQLLCVQGNQLQALCLQLTYFNHLQYFLQQPDWLYALCECCPRLRQLQLHAYGLGLDRPMIDRLQPLLARLTHFAIDYKEEDISKCREQPWIESVLSIAQHLQVLFIKFKRIAIRFPVHCLLPSTLQALHLPSCSLDASQLKQLIRNGGDRLEQLSLHSITSECLYLIVEKMPNLRKLSLGVRVPPTDDQSIRLLSNLKRLEQLNLHLAHLNDEPFDEEPRGDPTSLNFPTSYTVCEILSHSPSVQSLRLKNLPLIRRRSNRSWFVKPEAPAPTNRALVDDRFPEFNPFEQQEHEINRFNQMGVFGQLIGQFLEQRMVMDALGAAPLVADGPNLMEAEEQRFVMAQLQQMLHESTADTFDSSSLMSLHVRLDEPLLDCHYRHALEALLRALCRYRHLHSLQLINVRDRFVCPVTVTRLVTSCVHLQRLEIGSGRCVSAEVFHLFVDRAQKHPNRRYELKMARTAEDASTLHHSIFPNNLILF